MTRMEYENVCRAASDGLEQRVENRRTGVIGQVINCRRDYLNVRVGRGWQVWSREECEEKESG